MAMHIDRIEFVDEGFKAILNAPETEQLVLDHAQQMADRANAASGLDSFMAHSVKAGTRYIAFTGTTDDASAQAESEDKVLSQAVY